MPLSEQTVRLERDGGIARVTLARPHAGNAVNLALAQELSAIATTCEEDDSIRCVVLTGAGRLFCAGGDLAAFASAGTEIDRLLEELAGTLHQAVERFARMAKPLLVLVNGPAAGAGFSLAMAGDVVLCSRSAHFTPAYGTLGLTPDGGMSWWLPRLVGLRKAQEIILTNRRIRAEEAETIGLVTRVVDDDRLHDEGAEVAAALARAPTRALGFARALLRQSYGADLPDQLARETRTITAAGGTTDCREGVAAYFERRPPSFTGH
jgi:2-(1,2-epoxy-1,2-dihydrophenyl)acetyl-CoA isomerase